VLLRPPGRCWSGTEQLLIASSSFRSRLQFRALVPTAENPAETTASPPRPWRSLLERKGPVCSCSMILLEDGASSAEDVPRASALDDVDAVLPVGRTSPHALDSGVRALEKAVCRCFDHRESTNPVEAIRRRRALRPHPWVRIKDVLGQGVSLVAGIRRSVGPTAASPVSSQSGWPTAEPLELVLACSAGCTNGSWSWCWGEPSQEQRARWSSARAPTRAQPREAGGEPRGALEPATGRSAPEPPGSRGVGPGCDCGFVWINEQANLTDGMRSGQRPRSTNRSASDRVR